MSGAAEGTPGDDAQAPEFDDFENLPGIPISAGGEGADRSSLFSDDPFDLTGAAAQYERLLGRVSDSFTREDAWIIASTMHQRFAPATRVRYTSLLQSYMRHCEDQSVAPFPVQTDVVLIFLHMWSQARIEVGRPLQPDTFRAFRYALKHVQGVRQLESYDQTLIDAWLRGYASQYERLPVRAHAIRLPELARMTRVVLEPGSPKIQDQLLVNLLLDPDVMSTDSAVPDSLDPAVMDKLRNDPMSRAINLAQAVRLDWSSVQLAPAGSDAPTLLDIPRNKGGSDVFAVPNRSGTYRLNPGVDELDDDPAVNGGIPAAVQLCAPTTLRRLYAQIQAETGRAPSGSVLTNSRGEALTERGVSKILSRIVTDAGVKLAGGTQAYRTEDRLAMHQHLVAPRFEDVRDNTLCLITWWASLRRAEAAALKVGEVIEEARGRGLWVMVMRQKGDFRGDIRVVPRHDRKDGTPKPTCAHAAWHAYLVEYEKWLGRPVRYDDPAFPSTRSKGLMSADWVARLVTGIMKDAEVKIIPNERLSSHGLRAGYATEHLMRGMPAQIVAQRQGRSTVESLGGYIRLADVFEGFELVDYSEDELDAMFDPEAILTESIDVPERDDHDKIER